VDKLVPKLKGRVILEKDEISAKHRGEDLSKGYDYMVDEKSAYCTSYRRRRDQGLQDA